MEVQNELDLWKFVVPEFVFGAGARHLAGSYARNFGARRVLVVSDLGVIGIEQTLGQIGLSQADIPALAKKALQDACVVTNPRRPLQRDIEVIYEKAL